MFRKSLLSLLIASSAYASNPAYNMDKTYVQAESGKHFFTIELNTVIDQATAEKLVVTDQEDKNIAGTIELIPNGTALKTSIVRFYPVEANCFEKIVTFTLGDVATRIVPGTSGLANVGGAGIAKAGLAYDSNEAGALASAYVIRIHNPAS